MPRLILPALIAAAAAALSACGSAPEQRIAVPVVQTEATQRIAYRSVLLREVTLPSYAAGEDILVADETGVITGAKGLFWADDPARAVSLELTRHLARITGAQVASDPWPFDGPPAASIDLRIEEMLAHADGMFRLSGQYFVASETGRDRARLFALEVPLPGDAAPASPAGPAGLAEARAQAVRDLALDIARNGLR